MDTKLLTRLRNGFSANAYNQGITIVVQLVGVPILLYAWGVQLYGEWLILFAIPVYLSMADLGLSQAAGNDMTARVACGDASGALSVFQSLGAFVYALATIGLILSGFLLWQIPLENWFSFAVMTGDEARWVLLLLIAEVFFQLPDSVNHAGFRASSDYALHVGLRSTARLLQFAAMWIMALAGGGPVTAAAAFLAVRALATPAFSLLLIHRHRWLSFSFLQARISELHRLLRPALANIAIQVAQALNVQGMVLVVGAVLGPAAVVMFSTLRTLTRLALQLVLAVSLTAEPELSAAYGGRNHALLQSIFVHTLRAGMWLSLAAATGLALSGSFILNVWTHGEVAMHPVLFGCLLCSAVASMLWYTPLTVLKAANKQMRAATALIFASVCALAIAALLLAWTGSTVSAGLALLLIDAAMAPCTFHWAAKLLGVKATSILVQAIDPRPLFTLLLANLRVHR